MANLRFGAVEEAFKKRPLEVKTPTERPEQFYGKYVFNRARMYKYLPVDVYQKLIDVIDNGSRLDRSIADAVAPRHEEMGRGAWSNSLYTLVPTANGRYGRET